MVYSTLQGSYKVTFVFTSVFVNNCKSSFRALVSGKNDNMVQFK